MTRKSFAIRHLKADPPDEQTAAKYLLHWHAKDLYTTPESFPKIISQELFGNGLPLELEVGCGTAEFLCSLAANDPDANFVGIDLSLKSLFVGVERAKSLRLGNIKLIKAGIQRIYPLLDPNSLRAIYLHFPDPYMWPKYRKRKIFTTAFLDSVYYALTDSGHLSVMTDAPELFDYMLRLVERDNRFEKTHTERYLTGFEPSVKSRYQAIWERHGTSPLRFEVRKGSGVRGQEAPKPAPPHP